MELFQYSLVAFVLVIGLKNICSAENCEENGVLFYEDIACKPVKTEGNKCPSKYDCNFIQPNTGCVFKGKYYRRNEAIPSDLTNSGCEGVEESCRCDFNVILCDSHNCPPEFALPNKQPGCYHTYELGECCSTGQICNSTQTKKCEVDGETYEIGQKFYPKGTCYTCVCHENFTGKYDENTCIKRNCISQIRYGSRVNENCAPAYLALNPDETLSVLCCPDYFVCPDSSDKIEIFNYSAGKDSDLECSYGEKKLKIGEGLKRKVYRYAKDRNLQCECVVPPLLTCKEI